MAPKKLKFKKGDLVQLTPKAIKANIECCSYCIKKNFELGEITDNNSNAPEVTVVLPVELSDTQNDYLYTDLILVSRPAK